MNISKSWILGALVALSVACTGPVCLFLQPIKHTLTGRVHFRSFRRPTASITCRCWCSTGPSYVYSPAHSYQCMSATDVQLVGVSEFPESIIENSRVTAQGSLFESTSAHQYTRFLMNVTTLLPLKPAP